MKIGDKVVCMDTESRWRLGITYKKVYVVTGTDIENTIFIIDDRGKNSNIF